MKNKIDLVLIKRTDPRILANMAVHYSAPKGFVGRNMCYAVICDGNYYGATVGGSATRFLPGRNEFLGTKLEDGSLNNIVANIFYHVEKVNGAYPVRNFTTEVIKLWREKMLKDWQAKYGNEVKGFETLVEPPRSGECYIRDGWTVVGQTKGYTCKREAGKGTDSWSGKRVWDTVNLRPKIVLCRKV
jgi:hypothetical protein